MKRSAARGFSLDQEGTLWYENRLCVPNEPDLKNKIMKEAHDTPLSINPGGTKMYEDLKRIFWWHEMQREIALYVAK